MRCIPVLLAIPLLAPSVLGLPSVVYEGTLELSCFGASYHLPSTAPGYTGSRCGNARHHDAVGPTGVYEATFTWEASEGYETLEACLSAWDVVIDLGSPEVVHRNGRACAVGSSPLAVSLKATPYDHEVAVQVGVVTPSETVRPWLFPQAPVSVSYVVTHDADA